MRAGRSLLNKAQPNKGTAQNLRSCLNSGPPKFEKGILCTTALPRVLLHNLPVSFIVSCISLLLNIIFSASPWRNSLLTALFMAYKGAPGSLTDPPNPTRDLCRAVKCKFHCWHLGAANWVYQR